MAIRKRLETAKELITGAAARWNDDNALRLSAALSYYTVFSLGPLLLLATAVAGLIFGTEAARGELSQQMQGLLGKSGAEAVEALVASARKPHEGILATVVGFVVLLVGAAGVFAELKSALNQIWGAEPRKTSGALEFLRDRLLSFAMVLAVGFLLLVSLVVSTVLSALEKFAAGYLPLPPLFLQLANVAVSFALIGLLFAAMFKFLPDRPVSFRDVWIGAALTSFLFAVGKLGIGLYLGKSAVLSSYGASASVVAVMLWAYYSAAIFFFGAEFTRVHADCHAREEAEAAPQRLAG